jgi:hypothetical protein
MVSAPTDTRSNVRVEVLGFAGCPNVAPALAMLERLAAELKVAVDVDRIDIAAEDAGTLRFLGSPSVRVNGHDVEPGSDQRADFSYSCRTYATPFGRSGVPDEEWVRAALRDAARDL